VPLPVLMYVTCVEVYDNCATMLCRIAQLQMPPSLQKIDMHRSNNHPFYIEQLTYIIYVSRIQFANDIMQLKTKLFNNDPDRHYTDRVKFHVREMVSFLQYDCFGAIFWNGGSMSNAIVSRTR
jgi:hypothetical protein